MSGITIVALGDSTTAGTPGFKSPLESPPNGAGNIESQYAYWLTQKHEDWQVLNCGVNGERSDQIRARFDRDVLGEEPAAVVIIAGVNDIYQGRAADTVQRELEAMYVAAHAARIQVVAGTIIPFDTATPDQNARMHAVNAWIREYSGRHHGVPSAIRARRSALRGRRTTWYLHQMASTRRLKATHGWRRRSNRR